MFFCGSILKNLKRRLMAFTRICISYFKINPSMKQSSGVWSDPAAGPAFHGPAFTTGELTAHCLGLMM